MTILNINETFVNIKDVRADEVMLGNILLQQSVTKNTVSPIFVHQLELVGDDVVINDEITTSQSNFVTILKAVK